MGVSGAEEVTAAQTADRPIKPMVALILVISKLLLGHWIIHSPSNSPSWQYRTPPRSLWDGLPPRCICPPVSTTLRLSVPPMWFHLHTVRLAQRRFGRSLLQLGSERGGRRGEEGGVEGKSVPKGEQRHEARGTGNSWSVSFPSWLMLRKTHLNLHF